MGQRYLRIILHDNVDAAAFEKFCAENDFSITNRFEETQDSAFQIVARNADGDEIKYSDDQFLSVKVLEILSEDLESISMKTKMSLSHLDDSVVLESAEDDRASAAEKAVWLTCATALREQAGRARLSGLVAKRFKDPAAQVRIAAVVCAGWLEWPDLIALLPPLRDDTDPTVSSYASAFLKVADGG